VANCPPPPQSLTDCYDPSNSQIIPSTIDPFELILNKVVDYMLSTDYVTAIDGDLEEDDGDDAGLSKVPISTISLIKLSFLHFPNAASFNIPQQLQLPQFTQEHQSASADKSFSPLMSPIFTTNPYHGLSLLFFHPAHRSNNLLLTLPLVLRKSRWYTMKKTMRTRSKTPFFGIILFLSRPGTRIRYSVSVTYYS